MFAPPHPATFREPIGPEEELVVAFYNLRCGFQKFETANWSFMTSSARAKDRYEARREAGRVVRDTVSAALTTVRKQRRKLARLEAHLESLLPKEP